MKKIRVGIVNYLNTAPLIFGLKNSAIREQIELVPDYPANLARALREGTIDMGLVPVAAIPELKDWSLVGNYCIASDGPVASVCIFSETPMERVERVYLDYQSRTSVELAEILLRDYWKVDPELVPAAAGYRQKIGGTTAGLVIGDRSFEQRGRSPFIYDLGEAWKAHTGLPFVFAAWVSNHLLPDDFIKAFDDANAYGLARLSEVVALHPFELFDLHDYYTKNVSYHLDERRREGLRRFMELRKSLSAARSDAAAG